MAVERTPDLKYGSKQGFSLQPVYIFTFIWSICIFEAFALDLIKTAWPLFDTLKHVSVQTM